MFLGYFATAEEAALCLARTPEGRAAAEAAPQPPLTAEEAMEQAEAEGLTLLRKEGNTTGFKGVTVDPRCKGKPYRAQVLRGGKYVTLGCFLTAEEAALCIARTPEGRARVSTGNEPHVTVIEGLAFVSSFSGRQKAVGCARQPSA